MGKNKQYQLGQYEKSMPNELTWEEKLSYCKEFGFDYLEMSIDESDAKLARLKWSDNEIDALRHLMEEKDLYIKSICLSGHRRFPLGDEDSEITKKALEIMQEAVDLAYKLGVPIIQLAGYDVYYKDGNEKTKINFIENLKKATLMAANKGILLGFETMETPFMDTVGKSMEYVKLVDSPYLHVYPDFGNCTNAALKYGHNVLDDYRLGKGHIIAGHLKEMLPGKYREVPFGTGQTDFKGGIEVLKELGVRRFVGEFWYVGQEDWQKDCYLANTFLRSYLDEVFKED